MCSAVIPALQLIACCSLLRSLYDDDPALHAEAFSLPVCDPGSLAQVVGDLAQFMVQNELTEKELVDRAETLDFPSRCV